LLALNKIAPAFEEARAQLVISACPE